MTEQIMHSILLALHNIALVGCAAAPFYNRNLVLMRAQYGPKLHYELDKVVEDTLQGNVPYCIAFMVTLIITGIAMPLNHYFFAGAFRQLHVVAATALVIKLACIGGMIVIMWIIFNKLNPRLKEIFGKFNPGDTPDTALEAEFFAIRARRKALCDRCLIFAIGVLIFSAFLGFAV